MGVAIRGNDIPIEEILETLKLADFIELTGQKFTSRKPAIERQLSLPDIEQKLDGYLKIDDYCKTRNVYIDFDFLEETWDRIRKED